VYGNVGFDPNLGKTRTGSAPAYGSISSLTVYEPLTLEKRELARIRYFMDVPCPLADEVEAVSENVGSGQTLMGVIEEPQARDEQRLGPCLFSIRL
jgi:hypothetical protein